MLSEAHIASLSRQQTGPPPVLSKANSHAVLSPTVRTQTAINPLETRRAYSQYISHIYVYCIIVVGLSHCYVLAIHRHSEDVAMERNRGSCSVGCEAVHVASIAITNINVCQWLIIAEAVTRTAFGSFKKGLV